jgi:membrane fusion protein (multidrug efflux system)
MRATRASVPVPSSAAAPLRAVLFHGALRRSHAWRGRYAPLISGALLSSGALLISAALLAGCGGEPQEAAITAPPVMVAPVEVRPVRDRIEATGQLLAKSQASVAAQVGGQVTRIHMEEGTAVEAGQIVLEIDPARRQLEVSNERARVAEANAQLADKQRENRRVESLQSRGVASQTDVERAQTELALARSRLEAANAQLGLAERALADSSVAAPFAGLLARRYVSEGEFVSPGVALFDLVALEDMEVEFHLAERDSGLVSAGDQVAVRVAPFPEEVFGATVTVVSPTIDPRTRTLRVKARVDNREGRLRPGLFARADLGVSERAEVVMIPEDAILVRSDGSVVFRLSGPTAVQRIPVVTGVHRDGFVEIVSGLQAGDVVVIRGQSQLVDGSVVEIRTATGERPTGATSPAVEQAAR